MAVGYYQVAADGYLGLVAVESDGMWATPVTLTTLPANAETGNADENVDLTSVSCSSATNCTAVGSYVYNTSGGTYPLAVPITVSGTTPTPGQAVQISPPAGGDELSLTAVACTSSDSCTTVGTDTVGSTAEMAIAATSDAAASGNGWTAAQVPAAAFPDGADDTEAMPEAISCAPSGTCTAVGAYDDSSNGSNDPFALAVTNTAGVATVGSVTELPVPANATTPDGTAPALGVSCPSASACTVAGLYATGEADQAYVVPITGGTPGPATELASPGEEAGAFSIACTDADDCSLVGAEGGNNGNTLAIATDSESGGTWGTLSPLPGDPTFLTPLGIACTSVSQCVVAGADNTGGIETPFLSQSEPALSVATSALPGATVGVPYSTTLQATGDTGANTWSVTTGSLPAGLTLDSSTGVISGTPTIAGQDGFIVSDSASGPPAQTATGGVSITISPAPATTTVTSVPPVTTTVTVPAATTTTTTTTTATTTPAPVAKVTKLTAKGAKVTVTVACSGATCTGKLALTAVEHLTGTKLTAITAFATAQSHVTAKKTTKTITLAKDTYTVTAGKSKTITLTLTAAAAKLLSAHHSFKADLTVTPTGAKKATVTKTLTLTAITTRTTKKKK